MKRKDLSDDMQIINITFKKEFLDEFFDNHNQR